MKHLLLSLLICLGLCTANAQNAIFTKYSEANNTQYVSITSSMLKLMGNKSASINGVHIDGMTDALRSVLIISSEDNTIMTRMSIDFLELRENPDYEVLMEISNNNERITTLINNRKEVKEVVMSIHTLNKERTFIVLTGVFTDEQLKKLFGNM